MKYQATARSQMLSGCSTLLSNYYLHFQLHVLWGALPKSLIICNTKAVHRLMCLLPGATSIRELRLILSRLFNF